MVSKIFQLIENFKYDYEETNKFRKENIIDINITL